MKNKILVLALTLTTAADASAASYRIRAAGLNCNFCAFTLERLLGRVSGVEKQSIDVDVKTGMIQVASKDKAFADPAQLRAAIEKGGYSYKGMEVEMEGSFVSAGGKLAFRPDGLKEPLALAQAPRDASPGGRAAVKGSLEVGKKAPLVLQIESFRPIE